MGEVAPEEVAPLDLGTSAITLVSAAVIAAGHGASDAAVELQMERIVSLANGRPMQRVARWSGAVHFPCVVLGAELEENTKRWLIRLATRPHPKWNPDGVEEIRCDRLDSGSPVADQIGRWAQSHPGHPAWATKVMEKAPDGTDYRVLVALKPTAAIATGITVPAGTPSAREVEAPPPVRAPEPALIAASAGQWVTAPPTTPASAPVQAKPAPTPEQIREGLRKETEKITAEPTEKDWNRDESAAVGPPTTEQRNRIVELAGLIGRDDAKILAEAAVGYEVGRLIVREVRSSSDAQKVVEALQNAWNDIQAQRAEKASA